MGIDNEEQTGKYALMDIAFKENQRYEVGLPWKDNISDELETNCHDATFFFIHLECNISIFFLLRIHCMLSLSFPYRFSLQLHD